MRLRFLLLCVILLTTSTVASPAMAADPLVRVARDGSVSVAGRSVRCERTRTYLDDALPNLGAAVPDDGVLILNPFLLRRYSSTVQLFVFHHECGHTKVGTSELAADCWAVQRGVRDGWLDTAGLAQVCRSFGNAPETDTHPSGRRRCAQLERCFADASSALARARTEQEARVAATRPPTPQLVEGPRLLWSSRLRRPS